jgi:hypothetical protein
MTSLTNRAGPTRIWKTINGKNVKTSDGKDIGEIKKISENHLLLEQGKVHKRRFWIPKYVADAFDGKILWLVLSEDEVRGRYQYGIEPPTQENYASDFEHFRKTQHGQKISYASDFNENIRVVENYSNVRDLQSIAPTENPGPVKEEIDTPGKEDDQKEKEKSKDTEMSKRDSNQSATKYYSKQPVNINLSRTIERSVQPIVGKPTESDLESSVEAKKKDDNNSGPSPVRLPPSSDTILETHHTDNEDMKSLSDAHKEAVNPVKITSNEREQTTMHSAISTSATMDKPGNVFTIASPLSSIYMSQKNKETDSRPSVVEIGPTKMEEKPLDNILPKTSIQSHPMIASSQTSIVSDKTKDTDIQPVLAQVTQPVVAQVTQPIVEVRPEEQQIVPVSEKNEETSLDLTITAKLKSTSIEEVKPTSTSLIPTNLEQSNQVSLYDNSHTYTDDTENVNSMLGGYFDPFLVGMAMWQAWLNMCNEFASIGTSLSLNWFESFWKYLTPSTKEATDDR